MAGGAGARPDQPVSRRVCYPFGPKHGGHRVVRRREFITLVGGAAVAWPLAARAQQRERRVAVLMSLADDSEGQVRLAAFLRGLAAMGWSDGRNVRIDTRWGAGDTDRMR